MSWERRWHPLREEWVTITSHRNSRPWSGANADGEAQSMPHYVDNCYLCPGNQRVSGETNADYTSVFVFDNDHPAFSLAAPSTLDAAPGIYRNSPARGICRVLCYSPRHDLTMAELPVEEVAAVVNCWATQTEALAQLDDINHVLVFENKGEIVGVSNSHPHGQIYAADFVFKTIEEELGAMQRYFDTHGRSLFADILATEQDAGARVVAENDTAIAFVPYFARFPFETYVVPKRAHQFVHQLDETEREGFAAVLKEVLVRMDNLWRMSFPYMLVLHQAPCDGREYPAYQCHIQLHPPLRQPGLQKFLAGVETGGGHFLNDASPEDAARQLRDVAPVHYKLADDSSNVNR